MAIEGYSSIERSFSGSAQFGGEVKLTLQTASPYFWQDERTEAVPVGVPAPVSVGGAAITGLRIKITAGAAPVTDPSILSDAGLTIWHGTVPAGGTLLIDGLDGWNVSLGGIDVARYVTGPMPYLENGERSITITAPGAAAEITWIEGEL